MITLQKVQQWLASDCLSFPVSASDVIRKLNDGERVLWVLAILETVEKEGTINLLREAVNNPKWNDQPAKQAK